jgi:predicted permease
MESLIRDLSYTFRTLKRNPGFAAIAVLSLALGIGANTAIYTIYSAIFHRDVGVRDTASMVDVYTSDEFDEYLTSSYPDYLDYREQASDVFEDMITYNLSLAILDEGENTEFVFGEEVTGNYFDVLGLQPLMGRTFIPEEDDAYGAPPTVVVSYTTWQRRYGSDPEIVGKSMKLNGTAFTIIGVMPKKFTGMFPFYVDMWVPIHFHDIIMPPGTFGDDVNRPNRLESRGSRNLWVKGRLKPGVTVEQARASLATVSARLAEEYPESNEGRESRALPSDDVALIPFLDGPIKAFTMFLMIMVGLVLVIACTNLAGMTLARASRRRKEIGVRLAIGAGRWRLTRQLLTESITLALLGGVAGLVFARWLLTVLVAVQPPIPIAINLDLGLDTGVLAFTFALSLLTGVVFGLLPSLRATRPDLVGVLKDSYGALEGRLRRFGIRSGLVVVQVAVSALLLLCAGLFLRSLGNVSNVDYGYTLRQGVIATMDLSYRGYTQEAGNQFFDELKQRLQVIPGVEAVAYADDLPLDASLSTTSMFPQGTDVPYDEEDGVEVDRAEVGPDYFRAMGIQIVFGRPFDSTDLPDGERVAIVNESFARRFWPDESALGKRFERGSSSRTPFTIVGVARDGKYRTLGEQARLFAYTALSQNPISFRTAIVRTSADDRQILPIVRSEVRAMDPDLPMFQLITVPEHGELMLFLPRLVAALVTGLGVLSLILGTTGLYGIIAYDVSRRTREVGIRVALGSDRRGVIQLILWDGMKLVVVGLSVGIILAAAITGAIRLLLYGISPLDPVTFIVVPALFLGITTATTIGLARRAASVDPVIALRTE